MLVVLRPRWLPGFAAMHAPRVALFALYFFGALHKLNRDYFDPMLSCAVNTFVGVVPDWLDGLATFSAASRSALIVGSLLAESSLPIPLAFGRTRRVGSAAGAFFHAGVFPVTRSGGG